MEGKKNHRMKKGFSFKTQINNMINYIKFNKRNFNDNENVYKYFKIYERIFTI